MFLRNAVEARNKIATKIVQNGYFQVALSHSLLYVHYPICFILLSQQSSQVLHYAKVRGKV